MTWLAASRERIACLGLDPELGEVLRAFGGDEAPGAPDLDAPHDPDLPQRIEAVLANEVDTHQAELFARRFRNVDALLRGRPEPEAQLLRVMLDRRGAQILAASAPHALRVRALVDFVWSQAAVLQHRRYGAPPLEAFVEGLELREFAPGLRHGLIEGLSSSGPLHVNVLRVQGARLLTLDVRGRGGLAAVAAAHGSPAAISGGYFLYSEPDIELPSRRSDPVGLLVSGGEVLNPPVFRRASILQSADGELRIERLGLDGVEVQLGGFAASEAMNVVHRAEARVARSASGLLAAVVGTQVVDLATAELPVPVAGFVIELPEGAPVNVGDPVRYRLPQSPQAAMAGGPLLLGPLALDLAQEDFAGTAPPLTFSQDETYDRNLLPRMGVGLTAKGEFVAVAVDGRNAERAPGLTLRDTGRLLAALGCEVAMNLDGGSSKRMLIEGQVVDLPNTGIVAAGAQATEVRPVHTAILFVPG